jgi:hypothetical protein
VRLCALNGYNIQPPSPQILAAPTATGVVAKATGACWRPYVYKHGIGTYLEDKYVAVTSFDLDACDEDRRLVSGVNTLGPNAQLFYYLVGTGAGNENVSNISVLCTPMIQFFDGAAVKIVQWVYLTFNAIAFI